MNQYGENGKSIWCFGYKREYHNPYGTAWISYSYNMLFLLFNSRFLLQMVLPVLEFLFQLQDIFKMHHVLCLHNRQNHHMSFTVDSCILLISMYAYILPVLYSKFTNEKVGRHHVYMRQ